MKTGLLLLFFSFFLILHVSGQDFRDAFIGRYQTIKTANDEPIEIPTVIDLTKAIDSTAFWIYDSSQAPCCIWTEKLQFNPIDSSLYWSGCSGCIFGRLFPNDSIYIYRSLFTMNGDYFEYYGSRASSPISVQNQKENTFNAHFANNTLFINSGFSGSSEIQLISVDGKVLENQYLFISPGINEIAIPNLPMGLYVLILTSERIQFKQKIVFY